MPSANPETPGQFQDLLNAVEAIVNNVPDRYHQCAAALKSVMMNVGAEARPILADMKAHPNDTLADEAKLAKLAITLGNAMVNYSKCIHTLPLRLA